jgi:hypothetical protein
MIIFCILQLVSNLSKHGNVIGNLRVRVRDSEAYQVTLLCTVSQFKCLAVPGTKFCYCFKKDMIASSHNLLEYCLLTHGKSLFTVVIQVK